MALHDELLALAVRLTDAASQEPGDILAQISKPLASPIENVLTRILLPGKREAELRRAISTAYYALFHLLIDAATARGVPTLALRPRVARNFEHKAMQNVCEYYVRETVDKAGQPVTEEIKRIALAFTNLQAARHTADYNIAQSVTTAEAQAFVEMAQQAFADWRIAAGTPAADVYLTELLLGGVKNWEDRSRSKMLRR